MKSLRYLIVLLASNSYSAWCVAQFDCTVQSAPNEIIYSLEGTTCNNHNLNDNPHKYRQQASFIPPSNQPLKTLRINFHIIQNSTTSGSAGNFENTSADLAFMQDIVDKANALISNFSVPLDPQSCSCGSNCYIQDSRFRFELQDVYFHYAPSYYLSNNLGPLLDEFGTNLETELNLFFVGDNTASVGGQASTPSFTNMMFNQSALFFNYNRGYENQLTSQTPNLSWEATSLGNHLAHELGHSLGLLHTYSSTCCPETTNPNNFDYLEDFWGAGTGGCPQMPIPSANWCCSGPDNTCSVNWMGAFCASSQREATPMQIGRIHRNAMLSSMRKYIKSNGLHAVNSVETDETWLFDIRHYGNIVIESGATLTIMCRVQMPQDGIIKVKKGAKLIVDGGIITNTPMEDIWGGIEIEGDVTESQYYSGTYNPDQGIVEIKNGAVIENAKHGVLVKGGGILKTNEAVFRNNQRGVKLEPYLSYIPNTSVFAPNQSRFFKTTFVTDGGYEFYGSPEYHLGLTTVSGVNIIGCTFENTDKITTTPPQNPRKNRAIYDENEALAMSW